MGALNISRCLSFTFVLILFLMPMRLLEAKEVIPESIDIPGTDGGVSFNDITYSAGINKVIVPSGATGRTLLIDPATGAVTPVGALIPGTNFQGGPFEGVTSADEGEGVLFMMERTTRVLSAWDIAKNEMIASTPLAASPDFIRYVPLTKEIWVTEPSIASIEIISFVDGELEHSGFIEIPGGLDNLIIDPKRDRAYTQLWQEMAVVIDLKSRKVLAHWPNACETGSHGLELDEKKGFLFAACREGRLSVLDADHDGKILGSIVTGGPEVDVIGYNAGRSHVYIAAGDSGKLSIIKISDHGIPKLAGEIEIPNGNCVTNDGKDGIWVCDPFGGRVMYYKDNF